MWTAACHFCVIYSAHISVFVKFKRDWFTVYLLYMIFSVSVRGKSFSFVSQLESFICMHVAEILCLRLVLFLEELYY